ESVVVAEYLKNYVPRQAILRGEVRPLVSVGVKAVQPAVGSKIDSARPVFGYRAHRVARKLSLFMRVIEKRRITRCRLPSYRNAFVAQANPQPAAAVQKNRTRVGFRQPCRGPNRRISAVAYPPHLFSRAQPQAARAVANHMHIGHPIIGIGWETLDGKGAV